MLPFGIVTLAPRTARAPYAVLATGPSAFARGPSYDAASIANAAAHTHLPAFSTVSSSNAANGDAERAAVWKYLREEGRLSQIRRVRARGRVREAKRTYTYPNSLHDW